MARRKRPDEQLRTLASLLRFSTSAIDDAVKRTKPLRKYAPEHVDRLERVAGEVATQLDACAQAADDAGEAFTRLLPRGTQRGRE